MEKKRTSYKTTNKRLVERKYISYKALQQSAQDKGITTKHQYEQWVRKSKPLSVPLYPWRVYEEWTTWGDFLGTDNEFIPYIKWKEMRKKTWRTYYEAARWVQKQNYKSGREYFEAHRKGEVPNDIPQSPHQVYDEKNKGGWVGWKEFLGKTIQSKVEVMQNITKLFAIAGVPGHPHNYFRVVPAPEGKDQLTERLDVNAFRVYEYEDKDQSILGEIITETSSSQGGDIYLCQNFNNLFFELDSVFKYRKDIGDEISQKQQKNMTNY